MSVKILPPRMGSLWRVRPVTPVRLSHRRKYATPANENYDMAQNQEERQATDRKIRELSREQIQPIHLQDLVKYRDMDPIPESYLLNNAAGVIGDITVRLARRLEALRGLPYLAVLNPYISKTYNVYYNSFRVMGSMAPPTSKQENDSFVEVLEQLVSFHMDTIPRLAKGFAECRKLDLLSPTEINNILGEHLRARIGTRILAEHHINLTHPIGNNFIGCIQKDLSPYEVITNCGKKVTEICNLEFGFAPEIKFDMGTSVKLAYPPNHLEYIATELLKNAFRAVCTSSDGDVPVLVTVIQSGQGVIIRIRDRGGGIDPEHVSDIFKFSYTTVDNAPDDPSQATLAGLGYGLPLSRAYAEFFGGKLQVQSYFGWGTDVYLTLKSPLISGYHHDAN